MPFLALLLNFVILLSPNPFEAKVARVYWDHVEGFNVVDTLGKEIYCGSRNRLYHTTDFGNHWAEIGELPEFTLIKQIVVFNNKTLLVIASSGFHGTAYLSIDSGQTFEPTLACTGDGCCAVCDSATRKVYIATVDPFCLMVSSDSGATWGSSGAKIDDLKNPFVCSVLLREQDNTKTFYVSTSRPAVVYCRSEHDKKWHKCFTDARGINREIPLVTAWGKRLIACAASGTNMSPEKLYISDDNGVSWRGIECPFNIWGIGVSNKDSSTMWIGNYATYLGSAHNTDLRFSRDGGSTWTPVSECSAKLFWQFQVLPNQTLDAATDSGLLAVKLQ